MAFDRRAEDPAGLERSVQEYWRLPVAEGSVDSLALSLTLAPTFTVWFLPAFAEGVWKDHLRLDNVNSLERSTRIVNVSTLLATPLDEFVPKWSLPCPGSTRTDGVKLLSVAVEAEFSPPFFRNSARYVTNHCALPACRSLTSS